MAQRLIQKKLGWWGSSKIIKGLLLKSHRKETLQVWVLERNYPVKKKGGGLTYTQVVVAEATVSEVRRPSACARVREGPGVWFQELPGGGYKGNFVLGELTS